MFDTLEFPGLSSWWWRYLFQFFVCYPAAWVAGSVVSALLSSLGFGNYGVIRFAGYDCVLVLYIGAIAGWGVARVTPGLRSSGQWIWVLPVAAFAADLIGDVGRPIPWPPESLFTTPGEGVIGPYVVGFPAFLAAGYSLGFVLFGTASRTTALSTRRGAIVVGSLTGLLCFGLRQFEEVRTDRWSRIRTPMTNVFLTHDAASLCANPESSGGPLTRWGYFEMLGERRACEGNQLLSNGDPGPPGSLVVDRVRVLTGPNAGAEGWVLEYALREPFQ